MINRICHAIRSMNRYSHASLLAMSAGMSWHSSAVAQTTVIIPDTAPSLATGTIAVPRLPQPGAPQTIDIQGGTLRGNNLFHSFERFDLAPSVIAAWSSSDPSRIGIRNIVNRVTGGDVSDIYGGFDSTAFPNADFYFINPAGIVLGENAGINVPRSFFVSTANRLTFNDGTQFNTNAGNGSSFSTAAPENFGFIGGQSGNITIGAPDASVILSGGFRTGSGHAAHFSAENVRIMSQRFGVSDAMVRIAAVGQAPISLSVDPLLRLPDLTGRLDIIDGSIRVGGISADLLGNRAALALSAGEIRIESTLTDRSASIISDSAPQGSIASNSFSGGNIEIDARNVELINSNIITRTFNSGNAGDIGIRTHQLTVRGGTISSEAFRNGTGNGGDIEINAISAHLSDARLIAATSGIGNAGFIELRSASLLSESSRFETSTSSTGSVGDIRVTGDSLAFANSILTSSTLGGGAGGSIFVESADTRFLKGLVNTNTGGASNAGNISIRGVTIALTDISVFSGTSGSGNGGTLEIAANQLRTFGASLNSATSDIGAAGSISLTGSNNLDLFDSTVASRTDGAAGRAGAISIDGGKIELNRSTIRATTQGDETAGSIAINALNVLSFVDATLESSSLGNGDAGSIDVAGAAIRSINTTIESRSSRLLPMGIRGGSSGNVSVNSRSGDIDFRGTAISTSTSSRTRVEGPGSISLSASGNVGFLSSDLFALASFDSANSGSISITAGQRVDIGVDPADGSSSRISTATLSSAPNDPSRVGTIVIVGDAISIRGTTERLDRIAIPEGRVQISTFTTVQQNAGSITIRANGALEVERADILSLTTNIFGNRSGGNAGDVQLAGRDITVRNSLVEAISTANPDEIFTQPIANPIDARQGDAGSIRLIAERDISIGQNSVISSASSGFGNVGQIDLIFTRNGLIDGSSRVDTDISGNATGSGAIRIVGGSGTLIVSGTDAGNPNNRSAISSNTGNATGGGSVNIEVGRLELRDGGVLLAEATETATGNGGDIRIVAPSVLVSGALSGIQARALGTGSAGSISLRGSDILIADGGQISTNAFVGSAGAINITLPQDGLLALRGRDAPVSITTSSGAGTGGRIEIASPRAIISDGGSILALGEARGANVVISSERLIRSTDALNQLAVDGDLVLDSDVNDVSQGTVELPVTLLDPFGILISRCAGARNNGLVSELGLAVRGPRSVDSEGDKQVTLERRAYSCTKN